MFKYLPLSVAAAVFSVSVTSHAFAFGDRCNYPALKASGEGSSMREAQREAINCWQHEAREQYGPRYSNWRYSGDRSISCSWNAAGTHFKCAATAVACGRVN